MPYDQYRLMLLAFVKDPLNRFVVEGREIDSIESTTFTPNFWNVKIFYKLTPEQLNAKKRWFRKPVMDNVTVQIAVEQLVAWSWGRTEAQLVEMAKKINAEKSV